ncbi:MAG: NAD(P)-binding domain-containing protein [Pseudomonadota bacterium]
MTTYKVAIVGSGPAGISAATRAASMGMSHVLLERAPQLSNTIFKYQKGKYIMATPDALPLRTDVKFEADSREAILESWTARVNDLGVNVQYNAEVTAIEGAQGSFTVQLASGETVQAENVVVAIGLQGNLRKMGVDGEDDGLVDYQLDDPKEYWDKDIVVIGAGDAAIENAVALAQNENRVTIVNRKREFARAKPGNISLILGAIKDEMIECAYNTNPVRMQDGAIVLKGPEGEQIVRADRVIARLGAIAPRKFIEAIGGVFEEGADFPRVSENYESDRPGIYYVGALAGYPLIKHCLNQGYEVIQSIAGQPVDGADIPMLTEKFSSMLQGRSVYDLLNEVRDTVSLFNGLTILQLREFLLEADIQTHEPGGKIIRKGEAGDSLFVIVRGDVDIPISDAVSFTVPQGSFFGEMGLVMGRRRNSDALGGKGGTSVIEIPRNAALKLIASSATARKTLMDTIVLRKMQTFLSPGLTPEDLKEVLDTYEVINFSRGEALMQEGDEADAVYVVQSGSTAVTKEFGGKDVVLAYLPAGSLVGETALLNDAPRNATVRASVGVEALKIRKDVFQRLLDSKPKVRQIVQKVSADRAASTGARASGNEAKSKIVDFLMQNGIGEATNAIAIDNKLCVRCDMCETACAETHDGIPRLNRAAGPTYSARDAQAQVHIPISCRHCEHPHCMADCPPNALYRSPGGAVQINDTCIGCGNCARNCPYDAIQLSASPRKRGNLLTWLLFGAGDSPGKRRPAQKSKENKELARKCDLCEDVRGGPACVRACPTGAIIRIGPEGLIKKIQDAA